MAQLEQRSNDTKWAQIEKMSEYETLHDFFMGYVCACAYNTYLVLLEIDFFFICW